MHAGNFAPDPARAAAGQDGASQARDLLASMLAAFPGRLAAVSSFGTESAVVLHLLAGLDPAVPVIFLDTGKLFAETLAYRDRLVALLGLRDVRTARPDPARLAGNDPGGELWRADPDLCCWQRKVEPLDAALAGFSAWITGRKRYQGGVRGGLERLEAGPDGRIKINPLAGWSEEKVADYFRRHALPAHPLLAQGYRSVGCITCSRATVPGEAARDGRWAGQGKTECGIHLPRQNGAAA